MTPGTWVGLVALLLLAARLRRPGESPELSSYSSTGPYQVTRVIDSRTLLLNNKLPVRLIGIQPLSDSHHARADAIEFMRERVVGESVTLGFARERRDGDYYLMACVYMDDWIANEELIRAGFATADTDATYSEPLKRRFRNAEQSARVAGRGIWDQ